jgi:hypothetical protein
LNFEDSHRRAMSFKEYCLKLESLEYALSHAEFTVKNLGHSIDSIRISRTNHEQLETYIFENASLVIKHTQLTEYRLDSNNLSINLELINDIQNLVATKNPNKITLIS